MTEHDLYEHRDEDGDRLKLIELENGTLLAEIRYYSEEKTCRVRLTALETGSNLAVEQLYAALGRFLGTHVKDQDGPPAPALNVDTSVTADDVRRIAADEVVKRVIGGTFNDSFRVLVQEEIRRYLPDLRHVAQESARESARVQIQGHLRGEIVKVLRDTVTRAVELGVYR